MFKYRLIIFLQKSTNNTSWTAMFQLEEEQKNFVPLLAYFWHLQNTLAKATLSPLLITRELFHRVEQVYLKYFDK